MLKPVSTVFRSAEKSNNRGHDVEEERKREFSRATINSTEFIILWIEHSEKAPMLETTRHLDLFPPRLSGFFSPTLIILIVVFSMQRKKHVVVYLSPFLWKGGRREYLSVAMATTTSKPNRNKRLLGAYIVYRASTIGV